MATTTMLQQPDVYETPDTLPATASAPDYGTRETQGDGIATPTPASEDISTAGIDAASARQRFAAADATERGRRRAGLRETTVLELLGNDETAQETPVQRFRRLQLELAQLIDDLASKPADTLLEEQVSVGELQQQVHRLQASLDTLAPRTTAHVDSGRASSALLISQLHTVQANALGAPTPATTGAPAPTEPDQVTYELYYNGQLATSALASQLEERIAALESAIGTVPYEELGVTTLSAAVNSLTARVALLDPKRLEMLGLRVKAINADLERQATLRQQQPAAAAEADQKINALYDKLERWDPLIDTLPPIVERLHALQHVHQEAATMVEAVEAISNEQAQIRDLLSTNKAVAQSLQENMAANTTAVQKNLEAMDARMKALAAKLALLGAQ